MDPLDISEFEKLLPEPFLNKKLIEQAFIHRSYLNETDTIQELGDNERLEFLGDSVLEFVVSELIYRDFPEYTEGDLTEARSALVRQETLSRLAEERRMGEFLRLGRGEESSNGRERPVTLCATFEAVIGAIYLDRGIEYTKEYLHPIMIKELESIMGQIKDPKSRLQELIQYEVGKPPRYEEIQRIGPPHASTFIMSVKIVKIPAGVGRGPSKQIASQHAAAMALFRLGEDAPEYQPDPELEDEHPLQDMSLENFIELVAPSQ